MRDWLIGSLIAIPLVALYIYADQYPSPWLSLVLAVAMTVVVGGMGAAFAAGNMVWMDQDELEDRTVWIAAAAGAVASVWAWWTIPPVFGGPPTGGGLDLAARISWSVASLAGLGVLVWKSDRNRWALWIIALAVLPFQAFLFLQETARVVGGVLTLLVVLGLAFMGRHEQATEGTD